MTKIGEYMALAKHHDTTTFRQVIESRQQLWNVQTKLKRKLQKKDPLPVNEAELERTSVSTLALDSDDLILLNLDKEVYYSFVEMQRLRDQQKVGGLTTPRQRALSLALLVSIHARPLVSILTVQNELPVFRSLALQYKGVFEETQNELSEAKWELESVTGKNHNTHQPYDTTLLEEKLISLLGRLLTKQDLEKMFSPKELLFLPLLLSKMEFELVAKGKNRFLLRQTSNNPSSEFLFSSILFMSELKGECNET